MKTRRRVAMSAAALLGLTLALTACGSNSSGGGSGTSTGSGTNSSAPIRLMVDTTNSPAQALGGLSFPYPVAGAKAAAKAINAKGGINGHQIVIDVCDNKADPNQSAVCARQAATNHDIALVGTWDILGAPQAVPILQSEKIPDIGALAGNPIEVQNPITFTYDAGPLVATFAVAKLWQASGCKKVAYFNATPISASGEATLEAAQGLAKAEGIPLDVIPVAIAQADVSAPVSSAVSSGADCASYIADGQTTAKLIGALKKAGYKGQFLTAEGSLLPPFLASLGSVGDGVKVANTAATPTSNDPQVTQFKAQMTAYLGTGAALATNLNEFAQTAWSAVQLVDQALTGAGSGDYTSAELMKKIPTMCDVNIGNYYPHLDFCHPGKISKTFPRMFDAHVQYFVAKNGQYTPVGGTWHNVAALVP